MLQVFDVYASPESVNDPAAQPVSTAQHRSIVSRDSSRRRSPFDAEDEAFDNGHSHVVSGSNPSPGSTDTKNVLKNTSSTQKSIQSEYTSEGTKLGSKHAATNGDTPLDSTFTLATAQPHLDPPPTTTPALPTTGPYKTLHKAHGRKVAGQLKSMTLEAARGISPFIRSSNMWDPEDDEWEEINTRRIADSFKESYKLPAKHSADRAGPLSSFGATMRSTVKSVWTSTAKKAAEDEMRQAERVNDQIDELENTWFCDPEGDLSDEVMKSVVSGPSRYFPAREPDSPRAMHVLDLKKYFCPEDQLLRHARPRLCDAVATVLSHTSEECIEAFLNPIVREFTYRREIHGSKGGLILIIRRVGNEVICGAYCSFGFMLQWKLYVRSLIGANGLWREVYATTKPTMMKVNNGIPEWNNIQTDEKETKVEEDFEALLLTDSSPKKLTLQRSEKNKFEVVNIVNETNPKFMLYQSRIMARYLMWDLWYLFDNLGECRATWETDGKCTDVRLHRALVDSRCDEN